MPHKNLPHWLVKAVAWMGGGGIFLVAFLDSSVLSFPFVTDALVMESSIQSPARMPLYCAAAAVGSLAGCIWLYLLARKGGEALYQHRAGKRAQQVKGWVQKNAFLSAFVPGILPPPFPFKAFVVAEGLFQVPLRTFVVALLLSRTLRYFAEGLLAARYGAVVISFATSHSAGFALAVLVTLVLLYAASRWLFPSPPRGH